MKLWLKVLISGGIGVLISLILPLSGGDTNHFLQSISLIVGSVGTYILIPLILVQVTMTTTNLVQDKTGLSFVLRCIGYLLFSTLILSIIGGLTVLIFAPNKIENIHQEAGITDLPNILQLVQSIVSPNALQGIAGDSQSIFAVFLFAVILGIGLHVQRANSKHLFDIVESLSRIFYYLNRIFVEVMVFGTGFLAGARIVSIRDSSELFWFGQLILVLLILIAVIVFVIYPLIIYLVGKKHRPFYWIKHLLAPALVGLFSGNGYTPLGFLIRIGNEDLRLNRHVWSWYYPLASIIGRAGTALITSACFIVVLHSYTRMEISILQFGFIIIGSVIISLLIGSVQSGGIMVSLALLSNWYGQGLEKSFLIIQPAAPVLISLAIFLDVATQSFIGYLLSLLVNKGKFEDPSSGSGKFRDEFMIS